MYNELERKMRKNEIAAGILMFPFLISGVYDAAIDKLDSLFDKIMHILPLADMIFVAVIFISGRFRTAPLKQITGALFAVTAVSEIIHVTEYKYFISELFSRSDISVFDLKQYCLFSIIHMIIFAVCAAICALTYFGVIRWKKKLVLMTVVYILTVVYLIMLVMTINYEPDVIAGLAVFPALCFLPENSTDTAKKCSVGSAGIILLAISSGIYAMLSIMHFIQKTMHMETTMPVLAVIVISIIAVILTLPVGMFLAPLLLSAKEFENDGI